MRARSPCGGGDARPSIRATSPDGLISPDPLPVLAGEPGPEGWAEDGRPPDGFTFLGARKTIAAWLLPCPICCCGWVPIVPDHREDGGYRLGVEVGCSAGCDDPAEMMLMHLLRQGELPAQEPIEADERAARYAKGCLRRILGNLPPRPSHAQLRRAAYDAGRWLEAGHLPADPVARALLSAAARAGHEPASIAPKLAADVLAGRSRPGRMPR